MRTSSVSYWLKQICIRDINLIVVMEAETYKTLYLNFNITIDLRVQEDRMFRCDKLVIISVKNCTWLVLCGGGRLKLLDGKPPVPKAGRERQSMGLLQVHSIRKLIKKSFKYPWYCNQNRSVEKLGNCLQQSTFSSELEGDGTLHKMSWCCDSQGVGQPHLAQ